MIVFFYFTSKYALVCLLIVCMCLMVSGEWEELLNFRLNATESLHNKLYYFLYLVRAYKKMSSPVSISTLLQCKASYGFA